MIIINEGFSNNYGDQLINKSICYLLNRKIDVTYTFQDLNRNIIDGDYSTKRINVKQPTVIFPIRLLFYRFLWLLKNLKRIIKTSIKNDFGVIGGGQLLLDNNIFPFSIFIWTTFFKLFNVEYSFFGVGTQGGYSNTSKWFIKNALYGAKYIIVRDELSKKIIEQHFNLSIIKSYDVGFLCTEFYNNSNIKREKVLIGVTDYNIFRLYNESKITRNEYYETWIKLIGLKNIKNTKLFYTTTEDRSESYSFKSYMNIKYSINLKVLENYNLDEFMYNITGSAQIISGRMHALIIAKSFGIKYTTYPISEKLLQFDLIYKNITISTIQKDIINNFNFIV